MCQLEEILFTAAYVFMYGTFWYGAKGVYIVRKFSLVLELPSFLSKEYILSF